MAVISMTVDFICKEILVHFKNKLSLNFDGITSLTYLNRDPHVAEIIQASLTIYYTGKEKGHTRVNNTCSECKQEFKLCRCRFQSHLKEYTCYCVSLGFFFSFKGNLLACTTGDIILVGHLL